MAGFETYPGLRAKMGEKDKELVYYMIKMRARDLVGKVVTAKEIEKNSNPVVDEMVQRSIRGNRSMGAIADYLSSAHNNGERFMGSFVIATFGGNPSWEPIALDSNSQLNVMLEKTGSLEDFGVLVLDGTQDYFVLDGQHRLTSLRYLFGQLPEMSDKKKPPQIPPGLQDDELSILLISGEGVKTEKDFRKRLRRIFTVINRHAKSTTPVENISMDEDDIAAVHTRRLLHTIPLFKWSGDPEDTPVVDTQKMQLRQADGHLTTIATIYDMNKIFLKALYGVSDDFFKFSPGDEVIDEYFKDIETIWHGLIDSIKEWSTEHPGKMKNHTPPEDREEDGTMDHLLFWPVGQKGVAHYLYGIIRENQKNGKSFTKKVVTDALKDFEKIDWDLFSGPWYGYTLRQKTKGMDKNMKVGKAAKGETELTWTIHNQGAAETNVADMISFLHGQFATDKKLTEVFRDEWENKLVLWKANPDDIEKKWKQALATRKKIAQI